MAIFNTQNLDQVFHALGDSTRRDMIAMLSKQHRLSASELGAPFTMAQPTISKHLKVLERSKLIQRSIEGRTHYFAMNTETLTAAETWIQRHRSFWQGNLNRLETLIEALPPEDKI